MAFILLFAGSASILVAGIAVAGWAFAQERRER